MYYKLSLHRSPSASFRHSLGTITHNKQKHTVKIFSSIQNVLVQAVAAVHLKMQIFLLLKCRGFKLFNMLFLPRFYLVVGLLTFYCMEQSPS
jgi:hypothetical protein